jgi:hypothetical protein
MADLKSKMAAGVSKKTGEEKEGTKFENIIFDDDL